MSDETKVEEKDEQAESNAAPALKKPVLLGRKLGMLQHFKEDGSVVAATIIVAEANVVTQVRTKERDGYSAIQLGFGRAKKPDRMTKAELGHLKDLPPMRVLREVRLDDIDGFATGQEIGVDRFTPGDKVHVSGVSKGKGFQGPVHLHHFTRGPKSHGSDHLRRQGSVGSGTTPGRVLKGLPGVLTLLRDNRFSDEEALSWLFRPDESLPGRPVDALRANRGTEVKRRAQALGF